MPSLSSLYLVQLGGHRKSGTQGPNRSWFGTWLHSGCGGKPLEGLEPTSAMIWHMSGFALASVHRTRHEHSKISYRRLVAVQRRDDGCRDRVGAVELGHHG